MRAPLDDAAAVHDDDLVGADDGAQAMGDDKAGAPFHQCVHGLLDDLLGGRIDAAGRLVEDQDGRVRQQRPGKGDHLSLANAQVTAVFLQYGEVLVRHPLNKHIGSHGACCGNCLFIGGVKPPVADIFHDGGAEQVGVLEHDPHLAAQAGDGHVANIEAVHEHFPVRHIEEAGQQPDDRALAGTCFANQGDALSWRGVQRDVIQHRLIGLVVERDVDKVDLPAHRGQHLGTGLVLQVGRRVEQAKNALTRSHRDLERVVALCQLANGVKEAVNIE